MNYPSNGSAVIALRSIPAFVVRNAQNTPYCAGGKILHKTHRAAFTEAVAHRARNVS